MCLKSKLPKSLLYDIRTYVRISHLCIYVTGYWKTDHVHTFGQWTLFLTRSHLLFYFLFRIRSIYFHNIYRLQMALGV